MRRPPRTTPRPARLIALALALPALLLAPGCSTSAIATRETARPAAMHLAPPAPVAAPRPEPAALCHPGNVGLLLSFGRAGSAVPLGGDAFLTCRHVLPTRGNSVEHAGRRRRFDLLAGGASLRTTDDWAVIRLAPIIPHPAPDAAPPMALDPAYPVRPGDTVHILGYWRGPSGVLTRDQVRRLPPFIATGRAVPVRDTEAFPRADIFFVETPQGDIFPGMSGGPAVVWDHDRARPVVVGMYIGAAEYEPGQSRYQGSVQIIRRIPPEALTATTPPSPSAAP